MGFNDILVFERKNLKGIPMGASGIYRVSRELLLYVFLCFYFFLLVPLSFYIRSLLYDNNSEYYSDIQRALLNSVSENDFIPSAKQ